MTADADYRPERLGALDCLTAGNELWLDQATYELLSIARSGGVAIRLPMVCGHREWFNVESPARLREYSSGACTRCLLRSLTR